MRFDEFESWVGQKSTLKKVAAIVEVVMKLWTVTEGRIETRATSLNKFVGALLRSKWFVHLCFVLQELEHCGEFIGNKDGKEAGFRFSWRLDSKDASLRLSSFLFKYFPTQGQKIRAWIQSFRCWMMINILKWIIRWTGFVNIHLIGFPQLQFPLFVLIFYHFSHAILLLRHFSQHVHSVLNFYCLKYYWPILYFFQKTYLLYLLLYNSRTLM